MLRHIGGKLFSLWLFTIRLVALRWKGASIASKQAVDALRNGHAELVGPNFCVLGSFLHDASVSRAEVAKLCMRMTPIADKRAQMSNKLFATGTKLRALANRQAAASTPNSCHALVSCHFGAVFCQCYAGGCPVELAARWLFDNGMPACFSLQCYH